MGSGLVGLHLKGVLAGKSFTVSRNWLALGGAVSPGQVRPQSIKKKKRERKCENIVNTGPFILCVLEYAEYLSIENTKAGITLSLHCAVFTFMLC